MAEIPENDKKVTQEVIKNVHRPKKCLVHAIRYSIKDNSVDAICLINIS